MSSIAQHCTIHDSNLALFDCLSQPMGRRCALPPEIILSILAYRSRWLPSHTESFSLENVKNVIGYRVVHLEGGDGRPTVSTRELSDHDILALDHVTFTFTSSYPQHHGTFDGSWTWLETGITRDHDTDTFLGRWELQRNRHAGEGPEDYRVEFEKEHELFTSLSKGDKIALWARALYPTWRNFVQEANIELCFYRPDKIPER